jgi:hypothetical protein
MSNTNSQIAQESEIVELSPKELTPILIEHALAAESVGLIGPPGSAKSELVAKAAKAAGLPLYINNREMQDVTDDKGLPMRDTDNANQLVWFKDKKWMVDYPFANFMDELPRAQMAVMGSSASFLLENRLDDLYLPKGTWHSWAGNRTSDRAGANRVPSIIYNRCYMYATRYDAESQVEYMLTMDDVDHLTMRYLRMKGDAAFQFDANKVINSTPRAWTTVAKKLFRNPDAVYATIAGRIGKGFATELMAFRNLAPQLPSVEEVLLNASKARVPESVSGQFLVTDMLADQASTNTFDALVEYAKRLPPEMQAKFVKDSLIRKPEVANTKAFTAWGVKFGEVLR